MWTMVVVAMQPVLRHVPDLLQGIKDIAVQHLSAIGAIESFDISILCWLAWLDVIEGNALGCRPFRQGMGDELGAVVQANA